MKVLLALLVLINTACAIDLRCLDEDKVDFFVAGLQVCSDFNTDPREIEFIVNAVEEKATDRYISLQGNTDFKADLERYETRVAIIDGILVDQCRQINSAPGRESVYVCTEELGGINFRGNSILVIGNRRCTSFSALDHELLHSFDTIYRNHMGHDAPYMFMQDAERQGIDYYATIEAQVKEASIDEFEYLCYPEREQ